MTDQGYGAGRLLGDMLVDAGMISSQQLAAALEQQQETGALLGETLCDLGLVNDEQLALFLSEQLDLRYVPVEDVVVDPRAVELVPVEVARRQQAVPVGFNDQRLVVATLDPRNVLMMDDIRLTSGRDVEAVIVSADGFQKAMALAYELGVRDDSAVRVSLSDALIGGERQGVPDSDGAIVGLVDTIVSRAIGERASDIHIEPGCDQVRVRLRIDGSLYEVLSFPLSDHAACMSRLKILAGMDISERRVPQDGRIQVLTGDLDIDMRLSSLPTVHGEKLVIRVLDKGSAITQLDRLGMNGPVLERFEKLIMRPYGMIVVTGPTGSGKTTTLMAALHRLNSIRRNIVAVEDPVEYEIPGVNHVQVNTRVGMSFSVGLRAILRQDPNVIMIGEIRDGETAEIAVRSALTGHLVLTTVHANTAAGILTRLIDMGIEPFLVASAVTGSVSQRLVRRICDQCKETYVLADDDPVRGLFAVAGPVELARGKGCRRCNYTGYYGRTGLFELVVVGSELRQLINCRTPDDMLNEAAVRSGLCPLISDGLDKCRRFITTVDEVMKAAFVGEEFDYKEMSGYADDLGDGKEKQ